VPSIRITATDTLAGVETSSLARNALDGVEIVMQPDVRSFPNAKDLAARLTEKGNSPSRAALATYAAVLVWAKAVEVAQSAEPRAVITALPRTRTATPIGDLAFSLAGDSELPSWTIYTWRGGVLGK
jgi:ABC-type branched-subunit amino acid transport system substrate-binding protein